MPLSLKERPGTKKKQPEISNIILISRKRKRMRYQKQWADT